MVCFLFSKEECPCLKLETGGPPYLEKRKNLTKAVCVLLMLIIVAVDKVNSDLKLLAFKPHCCKFALTNAC